MNKTANPEFGLTNKDKEEFEKLVKANMKKAYFAALGFVGSHDSAMEISQEAFLRAYKNFNKFDKSKKFFTWYYTILRNLCFNFIRDTKRRKETGFLQDKESAENIQDEIERNERIEKIEEALSELKSEEREIIILREFEGYSYKEIGELLNTPGGTVMSKLFYARKKLAGILKRKLI